MRTLLPKRRRNAPSMGGKNLRNIRDHSKMMRSLNDHQLRDAAYAVRESFSRLAVARHAGDETVQVALALSAEALRRARGIELHDVQLIAANAIAEDKIVEMATGEGKTFAAFSGAVVGSLKGNSCHVATPNSYLARRDFEFLAPAFEALDLSAGLLGDHNASVDEKKTTYDCDVVYGTGFDFGFDFLRDQAAERIRGSQQLGQKLLESLCVPANDGHKSAKGLAGGRSAMQLGHQVALVDEVDHVLLDDAGSPLILCNAADGEAQDAGAVRLARSIIGELTEPAHYRFSTSTSIQLTESGRERVHAGDIQIPVKQLRRPWAEYIQQALRAEFVFRRDVHYIVEEDEIRIIDGSTGRIYSDRSWNDGLHQAIEAKEKVLITGERRAIAQVTRQRYYRLYSHLSGMTGTATGCEYEFRSIYGRDVRRIPLRLPCRRQTLPTRMFADSEHKWAAIIGDVSSIHSTGRPILIGTRTIRDSELVADRLASLGLSYALLNGKQDAQEAKIVALAGELGAITIATNLAGRGTDIRLSKPVTELGGLHVIVSEPHELERVDRQLVGRCARQGDPGSAQLYASVEDPIIAVHGAWLAGPLRRSVVNGQLPFDISRRLRSIQRANERRLAAARFQLMKRDLARESLISGIPHKK